MKTSIITVSFNSASTIQDTIESVIGQSNRFIEHIIIDGASTDGTVDVIKGAADKVNPTLIWKSEPDNGIYDAMNKGINLASGDIVGLLNADDFYSDTKVIDKVVDVFQKSKVEAVFGDLIVVDPNDLGRTVRTYKSNKWHPDRFGKGYMPAHPTFFTWKRNYEKFGLFETDYKIAADYEMLIRLLYTNKLSYKYLPGTMVKMRKGGVSSRGVRSNITLNNEIIRACRRHGIQTSTWKIYPKYFRKIFELINH